MNVDTHALEARQAEIRRELRAIDAEHRDRPLSPDARKRWTMLHIESGRLAVELSGTASQ